MSFSYVLFPKDVSSFLSLLGAEEGTGYALMEPTPAAPTAPAAPAALGIEGGHLVGRRWLSCQQQRKENNNKALLASEDCREEAADEELQGK